MNNIKTYGEIQYYLYDGDKKEKKVSRESFMNSKSVSITHNSPKPKQQSTKSLTGKVIESFEVFCCEANGPNLSLNFNKNRDFKSMQGKSFDGGDGPSATNVPDKFKPSTKVKNKIDRGHRTDEQENRKDKHDKMSKEYRDAKQMDFQTTDDLITFAPHKQPTTNAGGRT